MKSQVQDLIYFGQEADAITEQGRFIRLATAEFPGSLFRDAYDRIKGERTEIILPIGVSEADYLAWILVDDFYNKSLSFQILLGSKSDHDEDLMSAVMARIKEKYPESLEH